MVLKKIDNHHTVISEMITI